MTAVIEPYGKVRRWAAKQPRVAKEHVSDGYNNYHKYYSHEESIMFWAGYWAGYRKAEEDLK